MEFVIQMCMLTQGGRSLHLFISLLCTLNIVLHFVLLILMLSSSERDTA